MGGLRSPSRIAGPPNKGMKLTKLSAAPTLAPQAALSRRCHLMPAPANGMDAGTASQLIPGVGPTKGGPRD
jgi:hypothetical protein